MAATKDKAEPLRKITIRTVTNIDSAAMFELAMQKAKTSAFPICRIWGVAKRLKPGSSDNGAYVKFLGDFRALDVQTGSLYRSSVCILPKFMEESMAGAMGSGDNVKPAQFGSEIAIKYDAKAATKYVFVETPLLEPEESDEMRQLEGKIRETSPKALPAPGKT